MTVRNILNACGNVNIETRVFIEDREGRIWVGNELTIPEYVLEMNVNLFCVVDSQNQINILVDK